jgi:hypothetical protein
MAAENLGFLGQFLGGLAAGKQMKQKRQASAAELEYKKTKQKADAEESVARKQYRDAMLGIARSKEQREAGTPANAGFLSSQITGAQATLGEKTKTWRELISKAGSKRQKDKLINDARADLGTTIGGLKSLFAMPGVQSLYSGMTPEQIQGISQRGIEPWMTDTKFNPEYGDIAENIDWKGRAESIIARNQEGLKSGFRDENWYAQNTAAPYLKAVEDLGGGVDAVKEVVSRFGPIYGMSSLGTMQYLTTGQMPRATRDLTQQEVGLTDEMMGLGPETYGIDQQALLSGQRDTRPFMEGPGAEQEGMPPGAGQQVVPYGSIEAIGAQVPTGAMSAVPIPASQELQQRLGALRAENLDIKNKLDKATFSNDVQKSFYDAQLAGYNVAGKPMELEKQALDNYAKKVENAYLDKRQAAELNKILVDTSVKQSAEGRAERRFTFEQDKAVAEWIGKTEQRLDQNRSFAQTNYNAAITQALMQGEQIKSYANRNPIVYAQIIEGKLDPSTISGEMSASSRMALQDVYQAALLRNDVEQRWSAWTNKSKPSIGQIIEQYRKLATGKPAAEKPKPGGGKPAAKPGEKKTTPAKSPMGKPNVNAGVQPKAEMPK